METKTTCINNEHHLKRNTTKISLYCNFLFNLLKQNNMLACKKRLINMRTVWYNADDERISLETHPRDSLQLKFNFSFGSLGRQTVLFCFDFFEDTDLCCWTQRVSVTLKQDEGAQSTAARLIWTSVTGVNPYRSQRFDCTRNCTTAWKQITVM